MNDLENFISRLRSICPNESGEFSIETARLVITEINSFLYTNYDGIGTVNTLGRDWNFFSEFHRYWNEHHREILDLSIDEACCGAVADALHDIYLRTKGRAFSEVYNTNGLPPEDICRVRMLTANQDFRGSRNFIDLSKIFLDDNTVFDQVNIYEDPAGFVTAINGSALSQNDKRIRYAKRICEFLIENESDPYSIIEHFNRDVFSLRNAMINYEGAGYGNKKTDMFIRDMVVLGVWDNVTGFEKIDVASDINTIRVALRTGILSSAIPLVSSFLDIFCLQYAYVDEMNAKAWRRVWELWCKKYPDESIMSPCLLDYFIYNVVGREFCKEILCVFECEHGHQFKWHSSRNKTCQICYKNGNRHEPATLVAKLLPCSDDEGSIAISQTPFCRSNIADLNLTECPFKNICDSTGKKNLMPPKSISIMGQTGWTTAYTNKDVGGGGLMA